MSRKKEPETVLSHQEAEQVQQLLAQDETIAQALHTSSNQAEAEAALRPIHDLPEAAQLFFLKELTKVSSTAVADIVVALNALSSLKEVRKEARRALLRLESAKIYPQWNPPISRASAIQVGIANPPRFWKGVVTEARDQGEVQLTLIWEQGYDYSETRALSFLLDFWFDGVKECTVELISKRRIQERIEDVRQRLQDISLVDCTLAEGKRLLDEAYSVNLWRQREPHKDYRLNLPLIKSLFQKGLDESKDRGLTFIHPELTDEEVILNFIGAWSLGDYGLAYDLLGQNSNVREGLAREDWIELRRAWASEAHPERLELGFVHQQESHQSSGLWLPGSARTPQRKETAVGWSLELSETPLSGTLKEFPMGTAINKETGRHWFWTSYTMLREANNWRVQSISDEGARVQGIPILDLQKHSTELSKEVDELVKQRATLNPQEFIAELSWRLTQLLHYDDALIARLPLDKKVYEDAYTHALAAANPERAMIYLERMEDRFPDASGETLRNLGATIVTVAYNDRAEHLTARRDHLLAYAEERLRLSLERNDDAQGRLLLAELFLSQERNDDAEKELQLGKDRHPSAAIEAPIEAALGTIAMRRERINEAIPHYQRVGELMPDYPGNWFNLGFALRQLGHTDTAAESYKRAIRNEPQDYRPYSELIAIYMKQNNKEQARSIAEQGIQANPNSGPLHALLASVHLEMGEPRLAQRELQLAEQIDPTLPIVAEVRRIITAATKR
ncbi:MAG TPA: tetratricopeptide repeat protein [Ktedonobacteraceae bacterium]|nr:tetratricopeptide repeat protein [Ktedonobacteraceae bacterium]